MFEVNEIAVVVLSYCTGKLWWCGDPNFGTNILSRGYKDQEIHFVFYEILNRRFTFFKFPLRCLLYCTTLYSAFDPTICVLRQFRKQKLLLYFLIWSTLLCCNVMEFHLFTQRSHITPQNETFSFLSYRAAK